MHQASYPDLDGLFNDARKQLLAAPWVDLDKATDWRSLLPVPVFTYPLEYVAYIALGGTEQIKRIGAESRDRAAYWSSKASDFFNEYKYEVNEQKQWVRQIANQRIEALSKPYGPLLIVDRVVKDWLDTQANLSLKSFINLKTEQGLLDYITPLVLQQRELSGMEKLVDNTTRGFADLFVNVADIDKYVKCLQDFDPPVLDNTRRWIGGNKKKACGYCLDRLAF